MSLFTIGHSTHSAAYFLALLHRHKITAVCDVRSSPKSRMNPHFDQDSIRNFLKENDIEYVFLGSSLGARPKDRGCYVNGRAPYNLISATPQFKNSLDRVRSGSNKFNLALMCAEKDPLTCHRTIMVCRHLTDLGIGHILADGSLESHEDAMKRLIRLLGVKGEVSKSNESIFESAYEIQGERICYKESSPNNSASVPMESFL